MIEGAENMFIHFFTTFGVIVFLLAVITLVIYKDQ